MDSDIVSPLVEVGHLSDDARWSRAPRRASARAPRASVRPMHPRRPSASRRGSTRRCWWQSSSAPLDGLDEPKVKDARGDLASQQLDVATVWLRIVAVVVDE